MQVTRSRPRLEVFLVRPSKYDDAGDLIRHWRCVLPSNTLACLHALTQAVAHRWSDVELHAHVCDEAVESLPERRIRRAAARRGTRVLVCLAGVQTSQLPRARDLALRLRAARIPVAIGGFHVSGSLVGGDAPAELIELEAHGVTLVAGEVEETWESVLLDAAEGRLRPRYDTLTALPDLAAAAMPSFPPGALRRFVSGGLATLDTSRGCPYACSFCTIIKVQGRKSRSRDPVRVAEHIRHALERGGTRQYFLTDDDLARNPRWPELFAHLAAIGTAGREPLRFLMQVDLRAHAIPGFVDAARRAGCFQVFLGLESLDAESLRAAGKRQNRVDDYRTAVDAWQRAGILVHVGYIIGFDGDTPDGVLAAIDLLKRELRVDVASFFMLTPLPGSEDHRRLREGGIALDPDLDRYDTFHAVREHPRMTRDEWETVYREAWRRFYTREHLRDRLASVAPEVRTPLLQVYLWYLATFRVQGSHPMLTGFFRRKPRTERRPGAMSLGVLRNARRRIGETSREVAGYARVLHELYDVWASLPSASERSAVGRGIGFLRALAGETAARIDTPTAPTATHTYANRSPSR